MPFTLEKRPGEPIVVVTCSGHLDAEAMSSIFARTVPYLDAGGDLYRIVDYHAVTTPFAAVLAAAQEASARHPQASTADPRIRPVMVGGDGWLSAARRAFQDAPFGSVHIPMFSTVDEALKAVRQHISEKE